MITEIESNGDTTSISRQNSDAKSAFYTPAFAGVTLAIWAGVPSLSPRVGVVYEVEGVNRAADVLNSNWS